MAEEEMDEIYIDILSRADQGLTRESVVAVFKLEQEIKTREALVKGILSGVISANFNEAEDEFYFSSILTKINFNDDYDKQWASSPQQ